MIVEVLTAAAVITISVSMVALILGLIVSGYYERKAAIEHDAWVRARCARERFEAWCADMPALPPAPREPLHTEGPFR